MKRLALIAGVLASLLLVRTVAAEPRLPSFLPVYYAPAFRVDEKQLLLIDRASKGPVQGFAYATKDRSVELLIENIECDRPSCSAVFRNMLNLLNERITNIGGEFHLVSKREIHGEFHKKKQGEFVFVYVLPTSILVWHFVTKSADTLDADAKFKMIRALVNRHRYQSARSLGNVSMGDWGAEAHEHARQLLERGKTREGLSVLRGLLVTSPYNYDAHFDFIEHSDDPATIGTSTNIVFNNAESRKHIDRAADMLGIPAATHASTTFLEKNETGLLVILIPLPPYNPWLLEQAAKTYEQITQIPVKIRRLKEEWQFAAPDRFYRQRDVQRVLIELRGDNIDFAGWDKARYASELLKAVESEDALSRYEARDLVDRIERLPGQYRVDPVLTWFSAILEDYRSDDRRTMYVGITEANIFSGDTNFIFSSGVPEGDSPASILSYSVMLAEALPDQNEYRPRLTERIAKELVPASLKQLRIPRPLDPSDPYSYSDGVARLDQKTLVLSEPVKEALKSFRAD